MVQASMVAGIAFTNVSLGIVHSMAHTIGGIFHVSHGLADAIILPYIIRYNEQNETAKEVYAKFAKRIGAENLHEAVEALNEKLNIPKCFKEIIPDEEKYMAKLDEMAALAKADGCTKTNPVIPEIDEDLDVEINDEDIRIDTYRSSGAGGQHINKTSSAIRITHYPTGIVVQCQNERSQHMNKDKAMQMLKAKLYLLKKEANAEKLSDIRGEVKEIGWGNQIRSYVLQPYTLVKDHRTDVETGNVDAVLDGGLDIFINGYLKWLSVQGDKKTENS